MKILSLQLHPNNNYKYNTQSQNVVFCSQPKIRTLTQDTVSFGAGKKQIIDFGAPGFPKNISEIKDLTDLSCIYCGEAMLPTSKKHILAANIATSTGKELVDNIKKSEKYLRGCKLNVAKTIAETAIEYPNENIQELLQRLAPQYKNKLENEQLSILFNLNKKYSDAFDSDAEKLIFQNIMIETAQWINNEHDSNAFKRKSFLYELNAILQLPVFRNKSLVKKILNDAAQMPQSFESESAFLVKYHRRTPREIAEQLFYESTSTVEHIKPKTAGGLTTVDNLAIACARCNNFIRNSTPLSSFVENHPEISENIRKQLNEVYNAGLNQSSNNFSNIEDKKMKNTSLYNNYVKEIAKTFVKESNGKIQLNEFIEAENLN